MGLEESSAVDAISLERETNCIVLSIVDSWDWSHERDHRLAIQSKINSYFAFVESGQIYESYLDAVGKPVRIDVVTRYPVSTAAKTLIVQARKLAAAMKLTIRPTMG